jgi:hypothetical protein
MLKTVAIDITRTVFDNHFDAVLYITRDIYSDSYIISLPVLTFSWQVWDDKRERDLDDLLKVNGFIGDPVVKERFVEVVKDRLERFDG